MNSHIFLLPVAVAILIYSLDLPIMSIFRTGVWFFKGCREYTKAGYEAAEKNFNPKDLLVDISKKSFVVTGANSGLGYQCALDLAHKGGTVHLVCRNEQAGRKAVETIKNETNNQNVHLHIVDMSRPQQVISFARDFDQPVNVLINNAGCLANERKKTEEGLDINFATNSLGSYLMTMGFIKHLKNADDPRVIMVSSGGMLLQKLDLDDLNFEKMTKYDGVVVYSQNKRQQVVMAEQLAKEYEDIFFASMHPGWSDTVSVRTSLPGFYSMMKDRLRTTAQGSDTTLWLAICQNSNLSSGSFFQDRVSVPTHLPLAWTQSSEDEKKKFMIKMEELAGKYTQ